MMRAIVLLLCLTAPVAAARVESGWFVFPASDDVHRLEWTLSGKHVAPVHLALWLPNGYPNITTIALADRPQWGLVHADWQAALNDPAYTVSTVTFDGISQSGPVVRPLDPLQLEVFQFGIDLYGLQPVGVVPYIWAMDVAELPEPATGLLLIAAGLASSAFRACRRR